MRIDDPHHWDLTIEQAKALQLELAHQVVRQDQIGNVTFVAGTDLGFIDNNTVCRAAVVILSFPELELIEYQIAHRPVSMPYIPGYLSFRECPALLDAMAKLQHTPDLILCDGQGIAHPRRFGVACHLGVITGIPSIGVGKSRLIGHSQEPTHAKGDWQALMDKGEKIGAVLRTREKTKPLFISTGHKISLETAVAFVLQCCPRFRLPETTRWADGIASRKKAFLKYL